MHEVDLYTTVYKYVHGVNLVLQIELNRNMPVLSMPIHVNARMHWLNIDGRTHFVWR